MRYSLSKSKGNDFLDDRLHLFDTGPLKNQPFKNAGIGIGKYLSQPIFIGHSTNTLITQHLAINQTPSQSNIIHLYSFTYLSDDLRSGIETL